MTNKPMLSVELMPCPMCLGKVRDPVAKHIGHGDFCFVVSCHCGLSFDGGQDVESAVRTWNRRAKPAAQHQGAPAVLMELVENKIYGGMHIAKWDNPGGLKEGFHKLYAEQPAPVAVVMPERKPQRISDEYARGWNDYAVQYARLNGVKP